MDRDIPAPPKRPEPISRAISTLCVGGDWACAHGDLEALGDIAGRLAGYTYETLHRELCELAELCRSDPDHAVALWIRLKQEVRDATGPRS